LSYEFKPAPAKILEGSLAGMANESLVILTLPVDVSLSSCEYGELAEKRYTDPDPAPPSSSYAAPTTTSEALTATAEPK